MDYLIGLLITAIGGLFFYRTKAKSAEALNQNLDTKTEVLKEDNNINNSKAELTAEEKLREIAEKQMNSEKKEDSLEELANFLNNRGKSDK